MSAADVVKALAVTAELTQTELSATALRVMASDLEQYPENLVMTALTRCRRELRHKLTLGDIIERLGQADGRPTADEAWALALDARDEALTVVWSDEICEAFSIARPVLSAGDKIGARMAFKDAYDRIARFGRESGKSPKWTASLGWDKEHRTVALKRAESAGLLSSKVVAALLPAPTGGLLENALFGNKALPAPETIDQADIIDRCKKLKALISKPIGDAA